MAAEMKKQEPKPYAYQPAEALALFYYLCDAYSKGDFTFREFTRSINALRFMDSDRNIWTIGAKSGKWYKLKGTDWIEGQPAGLMAAVDEMLWYDHINKIEESEEHICRKCGKKLDRDSHFCSNCGAQVKAKTNDAVIKIPEKVFCTNCGTNLNTESKFCTRCGTARR